MTHQENGACRTLVLGLGNPILSDDGVGLQVVRRLQSRFDKPNLGFVESNIVGLDLLDLITGYDRLIIIDAIKTQGREIGQIYKLSPEDLGMTYHLASQHDVNLITALELGKRLGMALPREITILAIEVADVTTFSEKCTPGVEAAITKTVRLVAKELTEH